jgi:hypothetical protein
MFCSYAIDHAADVVTDHRLIRTCVPYSCLGRGGFRRPPSVSSFRRSFKGWKPADDNASELFRRRCDALSRSAANLGAFHKGIAELVKVTPHVTCRDLSTVKFVTPQYVHDAFAARADAVSPEDKFRCGRSVARALRKARGERAVAKRDRESLFGDRPDRRAARRVQARHDNIVFSESSREGAALCIKGYYERLLAADRDKASHRRRKSSEALSSAGFHSLKLRRKEETEGACGSPLSQGSCRAHMCE